MSLLRSLTLSTPKRKHHSPSLRQQGLQRTSSVSSTKSGRRLSSPRFFRQFSSPSDLFKRSSPTRDNISPALQRALDLLELRDLTALETCFLSLPAFLEPWTDYRDSFLLLQPNGMPRSALPGQITREDILQFYTFYAENELRYDGRADPENEKEYNPDATDLHAIKKTHWGAAEYDKLLYVWLLQTFKAGKHKNPLGFEYFQCLNICTAWEEVIMPIVEAVRSDYNLKGRYHYGRLAKFIEDVAPSRLAFPEGNVTSENQFVRRSMQRNERSAHDSLGDMHPVTGLAKNWKRPWQEDEVELRKVYPQYGQLVERPKPKVSFPQWIEEQRTSVERKEEDRAAIQHTMTLQYLEGNTGVDGRPFSRNESANERPFMKRLREAQELDRTSLRDSSISVGTNSPIRVSSIRRSSVEVQSAIQSNPYMLDPRHIYGHPAERNISRSSTHGFVASDSLPKSSTPEDPFIAHERNRSRSEERTSGHRDIRNPSYEGTGYASPWLPTLKEVNSTDSISRQMKSSGKVKATRIPSPIEVSSNEASRKYHPVAEKAFVPTDMATVVKTSPPPVPSKNPTRYNKDLLTSRTPDSDRVVPITPENILEKVVSKENIRAALDLNDSDEDMAESSPVDSISPGVQRGFAGIGGRGLNTGESPQLQTYNSHMFPRSGSVRSRGKASAHRRYGSGGSSGRYGRERFGGSPRKEDGRAFL